MLRKLLWLISITGLALGQAPPRAVPPTPKAGVCPLPILPALPAYTEPAFSPKPTSRTGRSSRPTTRTTPARTNECMCICRRNTPAKPDPIRSCI